MASDPVPSEPPPEGTRRRLRLRYPASCAVCRINLSRGSEAIWDSATKEVTCLACGTDEAPFDSGMPGASASAEADRRRDYRVERARRQYGDHAAAVAEDVAEREIAASWRKGSAGESKLAAYIAREVGDTVLALHDRVIPGTKGNIDHIYVASTGIWVVDSKSYQGRVAKREVGPLWRRDNEVFVGGRNRTRLAKGVEWQVDAVIAALRPDPDLKGVEVNAALCFVDSEWGLLDSPFQVGNVWVLYPAALKKRLKKSGRLPVERRRRIARRLDLSLPSRS